MKQSSEIINLLGGVRRVVSQLLGVHRTRVYAWFRPISKGGTGGRIPTKHIPILLNEAKRIGAPIKAEDFFSFFYRTQSCDSKLSYNLLLLLLLQIVMNINSIIHILKQALNKETKLIDYASPCARINT